MLPFRLPSTPARRAAALAFALSFAGAAAFASCGGGGDDDGTAAAGRGGAAAGGGGPGAGAAGRPGGGAGGAAGGATGGGGGGPGVTLACAPLDCGPPGGAVTRVAPGDDVQRAIDEAAPGDTLVLDAGATYAGPLHLPAKAGDRCVTLRTSTPDGALPPGRRVSPADAPLLARVTAPGGLPAIATRPGAHHYRLIGLELAPAAAEPTVPEVLALGSGGDAQSTPEAVPHHLAVDRCYVHGLPDHDFKRGIGLNSAHTCVEASHVSDFHASAQDSQAIGGFNGPGPFEIVNNRLEGAAENVMFGGATPGIEGLVPGDVTIRGNHFYKPLAWREGEPGFTGYKPWVKNLFEIKNARDVLVEGNFFENNWAGADQHGTAFLLTPRSEGGAAPWASCERVTVRNNVVAHVGGALSVLGRDAPPSRQSAAIALSNNLFVDVRADYAADGSRVVQFAGVAGLALDHNTFVYASPGADYARAHGEPTTGFVYTNNVVASGGALWADCGTSGEALACRLPGAAFAGNVLVGSQPGTLPPGNFFPAAPADAGFADFAGGAADPLGFALDPAGAFGGKAAGGGTPGVDPAALAAALAARR